MALHPMMQGITGPEPNSVQGPPPSKRERERIKSETPAHREGHSAAIFKNYYS